MAEQKASPFGAVAKALGALADPGLIEALNPSVGVRVAPVVFQSIEPEGRWKPNSLVDKPSSAGRVFELAGHSEGSRHVSKPQLSERYGRVEVTARTLMSIHMPGPIAGVSVQRMALAHEVTTDSSLSIYVTWWWDGLEIWAGYAGLGHANGFFNIYDSRAQVDLQAIPFGNYYPAATLITWSGWTSGFDYAHYFDFRGAVVVRADGKLGPGPSFPPMTDSLEVGSPGYMTYCKRLADSTPQSLKWSERDGFVLDGSKS
jgi:hypothetical protein